MNPVNQGVKLSYPQRVIKSFFFFGNRRSSDSFYLAAITTCNMAAQPNRFYNDVYSRSRVGKIVTIFAMLSMQTEKDEGFDMLHIF